MYSGKIDVSYDYQTGEIKISAFYLEVITQHLILQISWYKIAVVAVSKVFKILDILDQK